MPAKSLRRSALQARADLIEDATGAAARVLFKAQALGFGRTEEEIDRALAGPDAEYLLVHSRTLLEPVVRTAVDRALAIGRRR
ncbi:hypothetical protein SEA_PRAIRIE_38 [Arthrobacter phage Prairie]|uniref:Uncharacterized protein n=1 Tax=Arthrobacter phage Prairie TaxID=2816463 RepID=A0A8A5LKA7_9CAUD|nr:hypothetical protein SEA_PRAIRIE_38 [Arthrobacter phage Prairie]